MSLVPVDQEKVLSYGALIFWRWQLANRITMLEDLEKVINLKEEEREGIKLSLKRLKMAITPYYATLMDKDDYNCPIRRQAVPTIHAQ